MGTTELASLGTEQIVAFTTAQFDALTTHQLVALTTDQLQAITSAQLVALNTTDLNAFTTDQFEALTTYQIAHLTTNQLASLSTNDIAAFTTEQVVALTTTEVTAFTTAQIQAMTTTMIDAFTTLQVEALTSTEIAALTTTQISHLHLGTPIVLDLDGTGIHTSSAADGVNFDLMGTGKTQQWGWVAGSSGLLVRDINHDGMINNGTELFGTATVLANGQRAGDGYTAMAAIDSNHDGKLSALDKTWSELRVWVDANHDGKTDAGELRTLAEVGVLEINLDFSKTHTVSNGNLVGMASSYTSADGSQHAVADVWFAKQTPAAAPAPALGELLAGPAHDVLGDGGDAAHNRVTHGAAAAAAPGVMSAAARNAADDELLRHQQNILL